MRARNITTHVGQAEVAPLKLVCQPGVIQSHHLITSKQLDNLALNGRNIIDFVKVMPGVVSEFDGSVSGRGCLDSFNVNGTRSNQHQFTIDGSSNVDTRIFAAALACFTATKV